MTIMHSDIDDEDKDIDRGDTLPDDDGDVGDDKDDPAAKPDDKDPAAKDDKDPAAKDDKVDDKDDKRPRGKDGKFIKPDADADADADDEDDEDDDKDGKGVENAAVRLDRLRRQRDAARLALEARDREFAALLAKVPAEKPEPVVDPIVAINTKLDGLYELVEDARADGNTKEAAKLQREIDAANREIVRIEAEQIATKTTAVASEDAKYDALLDTLETEVDLLNPQHEDFDPKAVKALEWHTNAYEKAGMSASKALRYSAQMLFGYGQAPAKKDDAPPKDDKVVQLVRKSDPKKAVDVGKKQPPDAANRGVDKDDTQIRVSQLSEEEFNALPAAKKAALRGDTF